MENADQINSVLVVGAGLTGLMVARAFPQTVVLEKARGVGGRIATRRTELARFDHGAQFLTLRPGNELIDPRWLEDGWLLPWWKDEKGLRLKAPGGLTSFAKHLAEGLDIRLNTRVLKCARADKLWEVETDQGVYRAEKLVLTAPLPQALELLHTSGLSYPAGLTEIQYAKALIGLFEFASAPGVAPGETGYLEVNQGGVFAVIDQMKKGLSSQPALAVIMDPSWSEIHFDEPDEASLAAIEIALKKLAPDVKINQQQLKKWRYSHPLRTYSQQFLGVHRNPDLFLAGDAFGGPSLNGALRSAKALTTELSR